MSLFDKVKATASDLASRAYEQGKEYAEVAADKATDMATDAAAKARDKLASTISWAADVATLHTAKGHQAAFDKLTPELKREFLEHRYKQIMEEVLELRLAIDDKSPEEIVDALIDLNVFAIGTLDLYGVDADKAWKAVHNSNMAKNAGIKPERPNPFGLPDLIKPEGWVAPSHENNHGEFENLFKI